MLRAILFDFDGVILDSEEYHFEAFRRVFEEEGVSLTREAYYQNCLGFNDVECFRWGLQGAGKIEEAGGIEELTDRKAVYFEELLGKQMRFFPGVCEFIRAAGERYPLAVTSMARRGEIESALRKADLSDCFHLIVSGEDVERTKPDPEPYEKTLRRLNAHLSLTKTEREIQPDQCLVIEDSSAGIQSAKAAGMNVLALAQTEEPARLKKAADRVLLSLEGVSLKDVEAFFRP
ncbi:MAG: HAD family hydrolase [Thermodesulfobacteriota bacterium]